MISVYWGTTLHKMWVAWYCLRGCWAIFREKISQENKWKSVWGLFVRGLKHDLSKYSYVEWSCFAEAKGLKNMTYGTDEYANELKKLKPALDHHYANNRHHPEFYENGVSDMTDLDLFEMICDWRAAGRRHKDGCMYKSLRINKDRFKMDDDLVRKLHDWSERIGLI